jgi:tRNA-specific 2-thiouridylase
MKQQTPSGAEIMVAMSGGVDSSVSALLLLQQNYSIAGMFMKNWEEDDRLGSCSAAKDAADAGLVAEKLGITLHRRNLATEYWDYVFDDFLTEYSAGRTPNPDILCNREIKFKAFLDHARDLGADFIATGHYVRSDERDGMHRLLRGIDENKDQSYFLYTIGQHQLAQTLFPVGELTKPEVRAVAEKAGLRVHDKKDSTGICFIGERNFKEFLGEFIEADPGEIRTIDEKPIGKHDGLMFHTLGQRQGLGIGGVRGCPDEPWYVLHKDLEKNILYVGQGHEHPWLLSKKRIAGQLSWVSGRAPEPGARLTAKVRYRQPDQACIVSSVEDGRLELHFDRNQRAATPGQSVVLYEEENCLGGGIIDFDWVGAPPVLEEQTLQQVPI